MKKRAGSRNLMIFAGMLLAASIAFAGCGSNSGAPSQSDATSQAKSDVASSSASDASSLSDVNATSQEDVAEAIDLYGSWMDETSQRAWMDITYADDGAYDVRINWGSSATETTQWHFVGTLDEETGVLAYENAEKTNITFSDDGAEEKTEVVYADGAGSLIYEEDVITWDDQKEHAGEGCRFLRSFDEEDLQDWTTVSTPEEAAQGAGFDTFDVPETVRALDAEYTITRCAYQDGVASVDYEFGATMLTIRKAEGIYGGTLSDRNIVAEYPNQYKKWPQEIGDALGTCYGLEEGSAIVTEWSVGEATYAITFQGLGGEEVGLTQEEVVAIASAVD